MEWDIIEYKKEYREKVISFWIEICIDEFGFKEWYTDIKEIKNEEYKNYNGNFWIAINNKNEVIGTIALKNLGDRNAYLKSLYVKKEYRKNGIAKELFNKVMEFAIHNNYKKIGLDTYKVFEHAIKFYEKNKFVIKQQIGEQYIMERDL